MNKPSDSKVWSNCTKRLMDNIFYSPDGCWYWLGATNKGGYGKTTMRRVEKTVHRISYQYHVGHIDNGLHVCHHCDNRLCINPHHLFIGTNKDNIDDKVRKGRQSTCRGEKSRTAKFTNKQARDIRNMSGTYHEIAKQYSVSARLISALKRFKTYKEA